MASQFMLEQSNKTAGAPRQRNLPDFWKVLAAALAAAVALAGMPVLFPQLANSLGATSVHAYWYVSRASAFVAFGMLWLSMLAGLGITGRLARIWPGMPGSYELHRFTSLLGIGFGLVHALVLLGDKYINYNLAQLLVPFLGSNYRPEWVGFGQVAFYLLLVVAFSFYVRDRIGVYTWRLIHMLSFALFLMVLIHGVQSGTDTQSVWASALYWGSAISVLAGSIHRAMAARRGHPISARAAAGVVAVVGNAQAQPAQQLYSSKSDSAA